MIHNHVELSPADLQQYQNEGYVALPTFFTPTEVAAMVAELARFKREGLGRNVATDGDGKTISQTKINYQIIPLNNKSDLFRALPFHPKVVRVIRQLIGDPFARQLDQIFLKPGRTGAGTGWHTDNAYFKLADCTHGVGMWIALHAATIANGTLHVIPGSFRQSYAHERDGNSDHHITFRADEAQAVAVELPAGGAVFFNYGVAHGTRANNTDHERAGLAYHFVRTDKVPADYGGGLANFVQITGPQATGGLQEYGVNVADAWPEEVARLLRKDNQ
ncbi:MAG: phytanoyl-CoA dioxygenase family protein [Caldilineaceae bacterium]